MRTQLNEQLDTLHQTLIQMGARCEMALSLLAQAIEKRDPILAKPISSISQETDQLERTIETLCLKILLKQQPVAGDLHLISASLKMITDMERIADQAEDIAEILPYLQHTQPEPYENLLQMAKNCSHMITHSIDAFVQRDLLQAQSVIQQDDAVDQAFTSMKKDLIPLIAQTPDQGESALDFLMIAKYFERIADHATNIAEWVIFSITGQHKEQTP